MVEHLCPSLTNVISVGPLDTSASRPEYVILTGDERSLRASFPVAVVVEAMRSGGRLDEIAERASQRLGRPINAQDVEYILEHLIKPHHLVQPPKPERFKRRRDRRALIGVPVLSPALLQWLTRPLRWLFSPHSLLIGLIFIGLMETWFYLTQAPSFHFAALSGHDHLMLWSLCLTGVLLHELGHVSACAYYRCPHGPVGVGLYGILPVFYADVSAVWRLTRYQRAVVDLGGVFFQALLSAGLALLYAITGHAFLAGAVLLTSTLILCSLNPLLRFDGYWLLSDSLGITNLHKRAWAYFKGCVRLGPRAEPDAPPLGKLIFRAYTLGLLLFAGYFIWVLVRYLPGLVQSHTLQMALALDRMRNASSTGGWRTFASNLPHVLIPTLLLLGLGRSFCLTGSRLLNRIVRSTRLDDEC